MHNEPIEDYKLKAETQFETADLPVHLIATNIDDGSIAETWLTPDRLSAHLRHLCSGDPTIVEAWMDELENNHSTDFISPQHEPVKGAATNRARFKAEELLPFGFSVSELRPWRIGPL